jgi:hypothetical protein
MNDRFKGNLSLVTGLRAERYDPASLGCYEKRRF